MRDLNWIISDNDRACRVQPEDNFSRACSFNGDVENGIVLHSALRRNTGFLKPGAQSKRFLAKWYGTNSQDKRNEIVESYFE
jgi:hypothetical protein